MSLKYFTEISLHVAPTFVYMARNKATDVAAFYFH